jgi:hypothetical protein
LNKLLKVFKTVPLGVLRKRLDRKVDRKGIHSFWFRKVEDKEDFKVSLLNSDFLLRIIRDFIRTEFDASVDRQNKSITLVNPDLNYYKEVGFQEALQEVYRLVNLTED